MLNLKHIDKACIRALVMSVVRYAPGTPVSRCSLVSKAAQLATIQGHNFANGAYITH